MREIKTVIVAGAGTMGASIAETFAKHSYRVIIYDIFLEALEKGKELIRLHQETEIKEETLTAEESKNLLANIQYATDPAVFKEADLVVEAILENLEIKHKFYREISELVESDVILCSNTSGLSITEIQKAVKHPERFLGMHWINPPHLIPLIEIIKGKETASEYAEAVRTLSLELGKKPVIVNDAPGFVLNRIQFAIMRECLNIVERDIASMEDVDAVMKYGLGLRYASLGPFQVADLGGLDIFYHISSYLFKDLADQKEVFGKLKERFEENALGVKNQKGFYDYSNDLDKELIRYRDQMFTKVSKVLYK
ncbi:3-hydroxyacyl-CoA dehydrogenase family protein [Guggenheimella bovis]